MSSIDNDSVRIICPNLACQRLLAVPEMARGEVVRCRGCGANIRVPAGSGALPAAGLTGHTRGQGEAAA
jgi:hypothetical protein